MGLSLGSDDWINFAQGLNNDLVLDMIPAEMKGKRDLADVGKVIKIEVHEVTRKKVAHERQFEVIIFFHSTHSHRHRRRNSSVSRVHF